MRFFNTFRNLKLGLKLNLAMVLVFGLLLAAIVVIMNASVQNLTLQTGQQRVTQEAKVVQQRFAEAEQALLANVKFLEYTPNLLEAITSGDARKIEMALLIDAASFGIDDMDMVDATGAYLGDVDEPGNEGEDALISLALLGIEATGFVVKQGAELEFQLAAVGPLRDASGEIVGGLFASRRVDNEFLREINFSREDIDLLLIYEEQILAQDVLEERVEIVLLNQAAIGQALSGQVVIDGSLISLDGVLHITGYTPLTVGGQTKAVLAVLVDMGELVTFQSRLTTNTALLFVILAVMAVINVALFARQNISMPISKLQQAAQQMAGGDYLQRIQATTQDEVGRLGQTFNEMAEAIQARETELRRLANKLERRTRALETSAEVSRRLSTILDREQLLTKVVEQVQDAFGYYHSQVYLVDEDSKDLVVAGSTGAAGQALLADSHRIPQGKGLIGRAAASNAVVLIPDVSQDEGWLSHPLLPDTRAEIAVPITRGEHVLGVLDVQHDIAGGLGQADVELLGSVAGQVSIALQNAAFVREIQAAAQGLREANRIKDTFMSSMSHELRTPLNSIIGFSEVLLLGISGDLPAEAQEDVQAIFDNGRHLLGIINDLLDLAKIESGTLELHLESIEIMALFDDVRANNAGLLVDKPVEMPIQIEDDLPALQADPLRVNQILNNLVSNAAKFTDEGSITLRAYKDDAWLCLEVQDTGVGISADNLSRVFERFQQTDKDHARSARGTGLGLDITRQLVELHGGTIEVRSQPGTGSAFCVRLPIGVE